MKERPDRGDLEEACGPLQQDREQVVIRRLRVIVAVLFAMGAVVSILGYLPEGFIVISRTYVLYAAPAGGTRLALYTALLLAPGIAVLWRPRWPAIVGWIFWAVLLNVAAFYLPIGPGGNLPRSTEGVFEMWPAWTVYSLVTTILFAIAVVIPSVRARHRSPPLPQKPKLPRARAFRPAAKRDTSAF
jgi:hypothetical protein